MLIYHGSYIEVREIDLAAGRRKLDFGAGFYCTSLQKQAEEWAVRKANEKGKKPIVTIYEFTDSDRFSHKNFSGYDEAWLMFVVQNRRSDASALPGIYDIITGNVADDRVVETIDGFIERLALGRVDDAVIAQTLRDLAYQDANSQLCFTSKKAITALTFKQSYEVQHV